MTKVMDLPNWPPDTARSEPPEEPCPLSPELMMIENVDVVDGQSIKLSCTLDGKRYEYDFAAPDRETAQSLSQMIRNNTGKSLHDVGSLELLGDKAK